MAGFRPAIVEKFRAADVTPSRVVIHCSSFCFGAAPTWREASSPFLNSISVGIDMMPYFGGRLRVLVDVELHDLDLAVHRAGDLFQRGRDHAARAAPFGPEIHHDRLGALEHLGLEIRVGNLCNAHGAPRFF